MSVLASAPLDVLDAYRTCEFATLGKDGTPAAWPTAVKRRPDGTLLLTTSLAFTQKAFNIRRDGRVALLFSDPTGSGLDPAPQIAVNGRAACPDEIMTGPQGAEDYWSMLFVRQPHSRGYVRAPMRPLMDWYYLRLLITVEPERVDVRPPLAELAVPTAQASAAGAALPGAARLGSFPTAVLAARDAAGAPVLARTRTVAGPAGYRIVIPSHCAVVPGPASLLVHRHDALLNRMYNALVRGELRWSAGEFVLVPSQVVEPMGSGSARDAVTVLRRARRSTDRYLERRALPRPKVRWDLFRDLARPHRG